ncbi:MAG: HAMP domain-containing sensor histidine kinase [Pseudomonadota bacterium]
MPSDETAQLDRLMYRISHDLCASARALVELPKWIIEDLEEAQIDLPDEVRENLRYLCINSKRLDRMVQDLLEYSRVGRFQKRSPIVLDDVLETALCATPMPARFRLRVTPPDLPFTFNQPDFGRVVGALLSNAVKHHDKDHGVITLEILVDETWIDIQVTDDGPGIPVRHRAQVTELLTTLKPRDEVEGSGMGLAIVERITEEHAGGLHIADNPLGRGTQVTARLRRGRMPMLVTSNENRREPAPA